MDEFFTAVLSLLIKSIQLTIFPTNRWFPGQAWADKAASVH